MRAAPRSCVPVLVQVVCSRFQPLPSCVTSLCLGVLMCNGSKSYDRACLSGSGEAPMGTQCKVLHKQQHRCVKGPCLLGDIDIVAAGPHVHCCPHSSPERWAESRSHLRDGRAKARGTKG